MNILTIAVTQLRITARNKVSFALVLFMPLFMIFIMGFAMKSVFQSEPGISRFQVLYVNQDKGPLGRSFDELLKNQASRYIEPISGTLESAEAEVKNGKYDVAIIVPDSLSQKVEKGEGISIDVISSGKDQIKDFVTRSVVTSFVDMTNTQMGILKGYSEAMPSSDSTTQIQKLSQLTATAGNNFIISGDFEQSLSKRLTSFQYFTASMLLFFMLTAGIGIGNVIASDRENKTYARINTFRVKKSEYLLGQILSNMILAVLQALIVILFTQLALGVDWGNNIPGVGLILLLMALLSSALGTLFSGLISSPKALSSAMSMVIWFIAFVSGGFSPIPALEPIGKLTFYRWGFDSLVNFMAGGTLQKASGNILLLITAILVLWSAALILFRRKTSNE